METGCTAMKFTKGSYKITNVENPKNADLIAKDKAEYNAANKSLTFSRGNNEVTLKSFNEWIGRRFWQSFISLQKKSEKNLKKIQTLSAGNFRFAGIEQIYLKHTRRKQK